MLLFRLLITTVNVVTILLVVHGHLLSFKVLLLDILIVDEIEIVFVAIQIHLVFHDLNTRSLCTWLLLLLLLLLLNWSTNLLHSNVSALTIRETRILHFTN